MKSYFSKTITILICIINLTLVNIALANEKNNKEYRTIPPKTQYAQPEKLYEIAVIGSGSAGSMAALRGAFNNNTVLFITGATKEQRNSRGTWVPEYLNMPIYQGIERPYFYSRYKTIEQIINSPFKNNLYLLENSITEITKNQNNQFTLTDGNQKKYRAKYVIMATGMMDVQPHIQNSIRPILPFANNQKVIYCVRCDGHLSLNKKVAVIGYSDDAAQLAILLTERYTPTKMSILTNNSQSTWDESTQKLLNKYNISVHPEPIMDISNQQTQNLEYFLLTNNKKIPADLAVVSLGVIINNSLAKQLNAKLDEKGFVIADENGETSIPGLYVAGDLVSHSLKQVYAAWLGAVKATDAINKALRLEKRNALILPSSFSKEKTKE